MMNKRNQKGFTLAELLIVVAIIAVLVAIAIPVFTTQLEKSREATDLANIRSAYAQVVVDAIEDNAADAKEVSLKQTVAEWQTEDADQTLQDICGGEYVTGAPSNKGKATITWVPGTPKTATNDAVEGHCTIAFADA